jgi:hypothetical protein
MGHPMNNPIIARFEGLDLDAYVSKLLIGSLTPQFRSMVNECLSLGQTPLSILNDAYEATGSRESAHYQALEAYLDSVIRLSLTREPIN